MVDRLFKQGLLSCLVVVCVWRRKRLAVTTSAEKLLDRLVRARAAEYVEGTARLSPALQRELAAVLAKAVRELS